MFSLILSRCEFNTIMILGTFLALTALLTTISTEPIENGKVVKNIKSFPYVVHLFVTFKHIKTEKLSAFGCGGVILKPGIVLTAAHCVYKKKQIVNSIKVSAGSIYRKNEDSDVKKAFVAGFRVHEEFKLEKMNLLSANLYLPFDFAMLWLKTPFTVKPNSKVQTAKLLTRDLPPNTVGTVVGWGQDENGVPSDVLKWTSLKKLSDEECKQYYEKNTYGKYTFCAMSLEQNCGMGSGDSGGPFIYDGTVIGILSFGSVYDAKEEDGTTTTRCDHSKPVVLSDIRMYREWIGHSLDAGVPTKKCKKDQQKNCAL